MSEDTAAANGASHGEAPFKHKGARIALTDMGDTRGRALACALTWSKEYRMKSRSNPTKIPKSKVVQFCALASVLMAAGLAVGGPAAAAEEIFLRLDGIMGGATASGHPNEIVVSTYSQAFSNPASAVTGGGSAGKVKCGEIIVMKNIDKSSPKLIGAVVTGNHIATGDIKFDSTRGNGTLVESYHVALTDVVVTDIAQMDHTPQTVMEQVTLSARQFKFTFTPTTNSGGAGAPITFSVDCSTNQVN
jgi:type VI secretion system secreted protein Hcp